MKRSFIFPKVLGIILFIPFAVFAQVSVDTDAEMPVIQQMLAPVKVDGKTLFSIRGISSYSAEQRAAAISTRIREVAANREIPVDSLKIINGPGYSALYADDHLIINVYDADAEIEHTKREILVGIVLKKTKETIELYRHDRLHQVLMKKAVNAVAVVVILCVILFLISWLFRRIDAGIKNQIKSRVDSLANRSFSLIQPDQLWKIYHMSIKILRIIIIFLLIAASFNYILGLFPWTRGVTAFVLRILVNPLLAIGKGFLGFLPDLAFLLVIFFLARYLLKIGRLFFTGIQNGGIVIKGFDPDWATPTFRIVRFLVIAFAVILAYPYIPGSGSNAFKGVSVFLGLLLSLGSTSFISNLIAGFSMTYRRAFKKGDLIKIGDQTGFVVEQEILVTRLRSIKNEEIVIPNSIMLNSNITNFSSKSRENGLILHTTVGIGYETPWRMVDAMLKLAADRTAGLLKEPAPFVLKLSLGDFAVNYEINAYCSDPSIIPSLYSGLHQNILDVFNENNIQIMTPAYEYDPETPKVVPREQWNTPLAGEQD